MIIQILPARLPWRSAFCSPIIRPLRSFEMSCRANETLCQQMRHNAEIIETSRRFLCGVA